MTRCGSSRYDLPKSRGGEEARSEASSKGTPQPARPADLHQVASKGVPVGRIHVKQPNRGIKAHCDRSKASFAFKIPYRKLSSAALVASCKRPEFHHHNFIEVGNRLSGKRAARIIGEPLQSRIAHGTPERKKPLAPLRSG
jgi:hypothetical protein